MAHELDKLDDFFNLTRGTSFNILLKKADPRQLNNKLKLYGITITDDGSIEKSQLGLWKQLMIDAKIAKRYWKNPESILEDVVIDDMFLS